MGDSGTVWHKLGAIGESVMVLYAMARLLKSRELGPAQLGPAIESNRADAFELGERLAELLEALRGAVAGHPHLEQAVAALDPYATEVAGEVAEAFDRSGLQRLGAAERLRLERRAEELGAALEGIRAQLELICAALHVQPVELLLANVVDGRSGHPPAFVASEAVVRVDLADDRGFAGDPRVLWPLFEAALRQLAPGGDHFLLQAHTNGNGGLHVRIGSADAAPVGGASDRELRLSLGAAIRVEAAVVGAVARHLGIGYTTAEQEPVVTISLG